jgi:hypothetical protein
MDVNHRTPKPGISEPGGAPAFVAHMGVRKSSRLATTHYLLAAALGLLSSGCDGTEPDAASKVVTDSAGVRIVESLAPRLPPGSWQVADEPEVLCTGGGADGDERVFQARSLIPLVDGGAALLTSGGSQVLVCRGGDVVADHGGRGAGPGEFATSALALVRGPGDSVVVVETSALTVLDLNDGGSRRIPVGTVEREAPGVSRFLGGTEGVAGLAGPDGLVDLFVLDLHDLPAAVAQMSSVPWSQALAPSAVQHYLWPAYRSYALGGDRYWWGDLETGEIRRYGSSGLEEIRRAPVPLFVADPERVAWAVEALSRDLRDSNPHLPDELIANIVRVEHPVRSPGLLGIVPADAGELWVRLPRPDPQAPPHWRVFGPAGEWITDLDLPFGFNLHAVQGDELFGVRFAELGLEWIERLTLARRDPG